MNRESKTSIVHPNLPYGVLVWMLPDGKFLKNANGEYLSLNAHKGDLMAVKKMRDAAAYYGYPEGQTIFFPGRSQATQSEWEDQMEAMIDGKPIPFDIPDEAFEE